MSNEPRIRKCPDGEALGARDLQRWSFGERPSREERKQLAKWNKPKLDAADRWLAKHNKLKKHRRNERRGR